MINFYKSKVVISRPCVIAFNDHRRKKRNKNIFFTLIYVCFVVFADICCFQTQSKIFCKGIKLEKLFCWYYYANPIVNIKNKAQSVGHGQRKIHVPLYPYSCVLEQCICCSLFLLKVNMKYISPLKLLRCRPKFYRRLVIGYSDLVLHLILQIIFEKSNLVISRK